MIIIMLIFVSLMPFKINFTITVGYSSYGNLNHSVWLFLLLRSRDFVISKIVIVLVATEFFDFVVCTNCITPSLCTTSVVGKKLFFIVANLIEIN